MQRAPRSFRSMQRSQLHAMQQRNSHRTARNARQAACRTREGTAVCTHRGPSMHRGTEALFGGSTARVRAPPAQRPYIICMTPSIRDDIYRYRYRYKNDKDVGISMKKDIDMHIDIAIGVSRCRYGYRYRYRYRWRCTHPYIHPAQASTLLAQMLLGSARTAESHAQKGDWSEACGHMTSTHPAS